LLLECSVPLRRALSYAYYAYYDDSEETGGQGHYGLSTWTRNVSLQTAADS